MGARAHADGLSATGFPTNAGGGSVEVMESVTPVVFWKRELLTDSGGPGEFRGGLGQHIEIEAVGEHPLDLTTQFDRIEHPALGVFGGQAGGPSRLELNDGQPVPAKGRMVLHKGDRLKIDYAGGGGYGPPGKRDRAAVREDVREGIVSPEAARNVYGLADTGASQ
jgi:N-methylhydantoinase B